MNSVVVTDVVLTKHNITLDDINKIIPEWASKECIPLLAGYRGSHAHGTYIPKTNENSIDDIDLFLIVLPKLNYYLSLDSFNHKNDYYESGGKELDIVVFELNKFFYLLGKNNPNIVSYLWTDSDYLLYKHFSLETLFYYRDKLLSQDLISSIKGYALSQLKRMRSGTYYGYMGTKRKELFNRFGYDCKNAAHCARLLLSAGETLQRREFVVRLPDNELDLIKSIKRGEYSYEKVIGILTDLLNSFEEVQIPEWLPQKVDQTLLNNILISIKRQNYVREL